MTDSQASSLSSLRAEGAWINGNACVAVFVHRLNAEQVIVFRDTLHSIASDVTGEFFMLPEWGGRLAPNDLITGDVRLAVSFPLERRVVFEPDCLYFNIARSRRAEREARKRRGVHARDLSYVVEIIELDQVAVLNAVLFANHLMLMFEIFVRLGHPDGGKAAFKEGRVITAAQVAVFAIDNRDREAGQVFFCRLLDIPGKLARAGYRFRRPFARGCEADPTLL